jgi:hypothetical protein
MKRIKKLWRKLTRMCLECGDVSIPKGDPNVCWNCSLTIIGDFDETTAELMSELHDVLDKTPLYFEDEDE